MKILKFFAIAIGIVGLLLSLAIGYLLVKVSWDSQAHMAKLGDEAPWLEADGYRYRDLNKNGQLDAYEDARQPVESRVDDLLAQMTLEEKAGMMFINMIAMRSDGGLAEGPEWGNQFTFAFPKNSDYVASRLMNHFNTINAFPADVMATWSNNIQKLAERTRLGIPVTIATDPRHSYGDNPGANVYTPYFSQWPMPTGLAATRDTALVREFGDIARQEYRAVGITLALHPMADLATEPRWARINGTFGEDAYLSAQMTKAYILGFQGDILGSQSVACMSKHFSGGGPQKDGEDAHFPYGREQVYPGNNFDYHLIPFEQGVFPARTASIMPYYGIPVGQTSEDVAFAFNKEIITGMLREKYGYEGIICTDWNIITDNDKIFGLIEIGPARAWGVEHLTPLERAKKALDAGVDQFGGEDNPQLVIDLVRSGHIAEQRIDASIRRLLRDKFVLGLFDNPYVDVAAATAICKNPEFQAKAAFAQRKSTVLLKNGTSKPLLPITQPTKIFGLGISKEAIGKYATAVDNIEDADLVIMRLKSPFEERTTLLIERFFRAGSLAFVPDSLAKIMKVLSAKPTIVDVELERPVVMPEIAEASAALIGTFGVADDALLDIIFGKFNPQGKLPFELPSSMEAAAKQFEDVPYDSENPLFKYGHGLSYPEEKSITTNTQDQQ